MKLRAMQARRYFLSDRRFLAKDEATIALANVISHIRETNYSFRLGEALSSSSKQERGFLPMTDQEKIALKVACIRAAATLTADPKRVTDVGHFADFVK